MEKIKVEEYCRTEEGYIGKLVEYIPNALNYLKIDVGREIRHCDNSVDNFIYTRYGFQIKHSSKIIDLIEVGDYVNGKRVIYIDTIEDGDGNKRLCVFVEETQDCIEENEIKSIVTKEQIKQIEYRIKE